MAGKELGPPEVPSATLPQDTPRRMFISVDGQEDLENGYCHLLYLDLEAVCPNY